MHIAFADDLFLFCKGNPVSAQLLANSVHHFSRASGLNGNRQKSTIFCAGMDQLLQQQVAGIFDLNIGQLPITYLGLPLHSRKLATNEYDMLTSKIMSKIQSWSSKLLSYAGRCELIRSVLSGITNFWTRVIILPKKVLKDIQKLLRNFLWSGACEGKRTLVAWRDVAKPKDEGGLGFKELLAWNKAQVAKLIFDIDFDIVNIWAQWCNKCVIKNAAIWNISVRDGDSWLWKSILHIRDDLIATKNAIGAANWDRIWNRSNSRRVCQDLYEIWRNKGQAVCWGNIIWRAPVIPRCAFTTWLAAKDRAPNRDRLHKFGMLPSNICPLCSAAPETSHHTWFACSFSTLVIAYVMNWAGVGIVLDNMSEWLNWFASSKRQKSVIFKLRITAFITASHAIWLHRNSVCFQNEIPNAIVCAQSAIQHTKVRLRAKVNDHRNVLHHWLN